MKSSAVKFARLQVFLKEIGFSQSRDKDGWRFEHPESNTVFLFRPYRPSDRVYEHDLFLVRSQLDGHGLFAVNAFDESLTRTALLGFRRKIGLID